MEFGPHLRLRVDQLFLDIAPESGLDDSRNVLHTQPRIQVQPGFDEDEGIHLAETLTSRDPQLDLVAQALLEDMTLDDP